MNIKQYLNKLQHINDCMAEVKQPTRYYIYDYITSEDFYDFYGFREWLYDYIVDYYEDLGITTEERREELLIQFMNNDIRVYQNQIQVDATLSNGEEYQLLMGVGLDD